MKYQHHFKIYLKIGSKTTVFHVLHHLKIGIPLSIRQIYLIHSLCKLTGMTVNPFFGNKTFVFCQTWMFKLAFSVEKIHIFKTLMVIVMITDFETGPFTPPTRRKLETKSRIVVSVVPDIHIIKTFRNRGILWNVFFLRLYIWQFFFWSGIHFVFLNILLVRKKVKHGI